MREKYVPIGYTKKFVIKKVNTIFVVYRYNIFKDKIYSVVEIYWNKDIFKCMDFCKSRGYEIEEVLF